MVSFWLKKNYLADLLPGSVDIHCHILPGIDDGAADLKTSLYLLRKYHALGIKSIVATPHIMGNIYPNTPEIINSCLQLVKDLLAENNLSEIKVRAAAEYMMDTNFDDLLNTHELLTLGDTYVLVEMSYLQPSYYFERTFQNIKISGYRPVLAHPERYAYFHHKQETYGKIKNLGVNFQLNALSLSAHYGRSVQKMAFKLLESHLYDFIGTDVHNHIHLRKLKEITLATKHFEDVKALMEKTKTAFTF